MVRILFLCFFTRPAAPCPAPAHAPVAEKTLGGGLLRQPRRFEDEFKVSEERR